MDALVSDFLWQISETERIRSSLTVDTVNDELRLHGTRWQLAHLDEELTGGEVNIVRKVRTLSGISCVLRVGNCRHLRAGVPAMEHQVNAMSIARTSISNSNVVPHVYAWSRRMMLIEMMPGVPLANILGRATRAQKEKLFADVVALVDELHSVTSVDLSCIHGFSSSRVVVGDWDPLAPCASAEQFLRRMAGRAADNLSGTPFEVRLRAWMMRWLETALVQVEPTLASFPLVFTHGDITCNNVLVDERTLEVTGILDWETSGVFPIYEDVFPLEDLAEDMDCKDTFERHFGGQLLERMNRISHAEAIPHKLTKITWFYCSKYKDEGVSWTPESVALFLLQQGHRFARQIMREDPVHVLFLQHLEVEGPGNMFNVVERLGGVSLVCKVYKGEDFPAVDDFDVVVPLGSPNSVSEIHQTTWMQQEASFLRRAAAAGKFLYGVCFGSQLIASEVFGASVDNATHQEIGFWPITRQDSSRLLELPVTASVFQWHSETWELPPRFRLLYSSEACSNQIAVSPDEHTLLVQFHPEITADDCQNWLADNSERPQGPFVNWKSMNNRRQFDASLEISETLLEFVFQRAQPPQRGEDSSESSSRDSSSSTRSRSRSRSYDGSSSSSSSE